MRSGLWLSLKRDKVYADIFYQGVKIATVKVSDNNRGNMSILDLELAHGVTFKIIKDSQTQSTVNEDDFNKEEYNS